MAFGLTNAPVTFQRLMALCIGELHLQDCLVYLDDTIVFFKDLDEHLRRLEAVFKRLKEAGLKLKGFQVGDLSPSSQIPWPCGKWSGSRN